MYEYVSHLPFSEVQINWTIDWQVVLWPCEALCLVFHAKWSGHNIWSWFKLFNLYFKAFHCNINVILKMMPKEMWGQVKEAIIRDKTNLSEREIRPNRQCGAPKGLKLLEDRIISMVEKNNFTTSKHFTGGNTIFEFRWTWLFLQVLKRFYI